MSIFKHIYFISAMISGFYFIYEGMNLHEIPILIGGLLLLYISQLFRIQEDLCDKINELIKQKTN